MSQAPRQEADISCLVFELDADDTDLEETLSQLIAAVERVAKMAL